MEGTGDTEILLRFVKGDGYVDTSRNIGNYDCEENKLVLERKDWANV